jgi:hypothetical protein
MVYLIRSTDASQLRAVAAVYEGLRAMRTEAGTLAGSAALGSAGISSVPCFSLDGLSHCLQLLRLHRDSGEVSVAAALSRSIPLGQDWKQAVSVRCDVMLFDGM